MQIASYKATRGGLPGLFNIAVRWWRSADYSHSELVFSDGTCGSNSWLDGGVRLKAIALDPRKWDVVPVVVTGDFLAAHGWASEAEYEAAARAWFDARRGRRYNLVLLLAFVLPFLSRLAARLGGVCSTDIAEALRLPQPWRLDPQDLHNRFAVR